MKKPARIVLSASRRTDIPAFYMDWFMRRIRKGFFEVTNPFNRRITRVPATPDQVHTIVFWSKNFGPFLSGNFGERLSGMGYHLFFNFTINSNDPLLEPKVPPLDERLTQLIDICNRIEPVAVNWRFDPICMYKTAEGKRKDNLKDFAKIARIAAKSGVRRCVTSFMDYYTKIDKRVAAMQGFDFIKPGLNEQLKIVLNMEKTLHDYQIGLSLCCEKELLHALPARSHISQSACIPNRLLVKLFGGQLSFKQDTGQRVKDGCGCMVSKDIGSY